jgi:PBSX family phage terminase large subunit
MPAKTKKLTPIEQALFDYIAEGDKYGCPPDQMVNFFRAGVVLQPKQMEMAAAARSCDIRCASCESLYQLGQEIPLRCKDCGATAVGVGGARGGGKSRWMSAQVMVDDCVRFPGLKFLYVRKSGKSLRQQIRDLLKATMPRGGYEYREQAGEIKFTESGSIIIIGHFKDASEIENYLGQEYDGIAYEELTTLTFEKFDDLNSCLRTSKKGWRPRIYAAWNWGGIGHQWVKSMFYEPWKNKSEIETRYILATVHDNRHNNPEYVNKLKSYVGWKFTSWYEGNPDFQAGAFFTNWSIATHVFPNEQINFDVTKGVRWFGSMDYGFKHPNCFYLHCETVDGDIYTTDEYHKSNTLVAEHAENIRDILRLRNLEIADLEYIAAGGDCFKTESDGSTIATQYRDNGIILTRVDIDRVNAWSTMQERLGDISRGMRPTWFIHKSCENLIAQIPVAQVDPKKAGDIIKMNADPETDEGGDDALEAARNGLVMSESSCLKNAKPINFSGWKGLSAPVHEIGYNDTDRLIAEAEAADLAGRG